MFKHSTNAPVETLEIAVEQGDTTTTLRLRGNLGIDTSPQLRDQLLALLEEQTPKTLVIDIVAASYIDTSGIATLLEALKIARNRRHKLCLSGIQGRVARFFEVTGLSGVFETNVCRIPLPPEVS